MSEKGAQLLVEGCALFFQLFVLVIGEIRITAEHAGMPMTSCSVTRLAR